MAQGARGWAVVKVSAGKEQDTFERLFKLSFVKHSDFLFKRVDKIEPSVKEKGGLVVAAFVAVSARDMQNLEAALKVIQKALPVNQAPQVDLYPVGPSFGPNWWPTWW